MDPLALARWQFGITTVYHFFMVPLTIGLSMMVAWFHTRWYRHRDEADLRLTKFFGKLFLINFAMGVVTGIVQEFQFGMGWADYSRFVGDVFGAPLAMEALVAFFLESTFLGLWIFGWGRIPEKLHLATIWAAAIGTWLSAYFIIAANSWMQHPVGATYNPETGRAEMTDIWAVLTNVTTLAAYPHVIAASVMTAGLFVAGISAWYLIRRDPGDPDRRGMRYAMRFGLWLTLAASAVVIISGDEQARIMFDQQPMKMAAAEALCETEEGAGFSVFAVGNVDAECDVRSLVIPGLTSFLADRDFNATIPGVVDLQEQYSELYGEGDYRPNLIVTYWSFRAMMGFGFFGMGVAVVSLWLTREGRALPTGRWMTPLIVFTMLTPFLGNAFGWIFTEMGRQPWVVAPNLDGDLEIALLTENAVSPSLSTTEVAISLFGFAAVYGILAVVEIFLLTRYVQAGPDSTMFALPVDHPWGDSDRDDDSGRDDHDRDDHDGDTPPDRGSPTDADDEQFAFAY